MKTEAEFNDKLKKHLRRARRDLQPEWLADDMDMAPSVYYAYERGDLQLSIYQLYKFMHLTHKDAEYIKQLFDDDWHPMSQSVPRMTNDE